MNGEYREIQPRARTSLLRVSSWRQTGLSMPGMIVAILLGGLTITCVLKMVPVYIESWNVQSILKDLELHFKDTQVVQKSDIRNKINKRMNIDMIDGIKAKDIKITKERGVYIVDANYEKRIQLLGNIDVVMIFNNNTVEVPISKN